jgi:hypothetical protein
MTGDFSIVCLSCDRFVIEFIGIVFKGFDQGKGYFDFCTHHQCKTENLENAIALHLTLPGLEQVFCRFPVESYIGGVLKASLPKKITIVQDLFRPNAQEIDNLMSKLSFQFLDRKIVFSDPRYKTRIDQAIAPQTQKTDYEIALLESTAIAYRTAWHYYRSKNRNPSIWSF